VKRVCAGWQTTLRADERFELLDEMHELHDAVAPALDEAGAVVERSSATSCGDPRGSGAR
jgi:hypothetical protein